MLFLLRFLNGLNKSLDNNLIKATSEPSNETLAKQKAPQRQSEFAKLDKKQIADLLNYQRPKSVTKDGAKELINYKVTAKISSIKMKLSNLNKSYFQVLIQNFETGLKLTKGLTEVDVKLAHVSLQDIREDSIYKDLIKLKDDKKFLIELNLKFFEKHYLNKKIFLKKYLNETDFDLILSGKVSKLQCVFLYQHLSIIMVFIKNNYFFNFLKKF